MRFENIYSCSTYSHNNDLLKAMKEKKGKVKLRFGVNMKVPRSSKKCDRVDVKNAQERRVVDKGSSLVHF
jgi:hypothetical protein